MTPRVLAVCAGPGHRFSKPVRDRVTLVAGLGLVDDGHAGLTVQHRSRAAKDPTQPNLRQVHLLGAELFEELAEKGFNLTPGDIGENVVTSGIDLLGLSAGTRLRLGPDAVVEVTGLRNPCSQMNRFQPGLMAATLARDASGGLIRKAGVMAIVLEGGNVGPGDAIEATGPEIHAPLQPV